MALQSDAHMAISIVSNDELEGVLLRYAESSRIAYRRVWQRWLNWLKKSEREATAIDANRYIDEISRTPLGLRATRKGELPSKRTIQKQVAILHSLYAQLSKHNPFDALFNSFKGLRIRQVRPTVAVPEDRVMELVEAPLRYGPVGLRDSAFLAVLFGGGLRISEAQKLNVSDIEQRGKVTVLLLQDTKNGDDAEQPMPKWASDLVARHIAENQPKTALFCEFTGHFQSHGRRATRSTLYKRFKVWARRIGLPANVSPHSARATAITQLLDAGLSPRDVQEFSRHKSVSMVEVYDKRRLSASEHPGTWLSYRTNERNKAKKKSR